MMASYVAKQRTFHTVRVIPDTAAVVHKTRPLSTVLHFPTAIDRDTVVYTDAFWELSVHFSTLNVCLMRFVFTSANDVKKPL